MRILHHVASKNGLGGFDSFKSQNGSWCKKDDTPKTQTAANPSQQLQNVFHETWNLHCVGKHLCSVIRSKNGLGGFDSFKSQNGSWCKKDDTPKTQTAVANIFVQ
jgi:hypothetical protein